MADQNFVDYVKIHCKSGAGGAGSAHFLRDKVSSKGGPDGGDGGRGGDVICRGNSQLWTLLHLKYKKHVIAESGKPGMGTLKSGRDGEDVILEVPLGTVAKDPDTGEVLFEINKDQEEFILMPGGRGGWGNDHFKTSTNQTPQYAQPGEPFQEGWRILELKILADVGLVGFPNAGKSTLLASLSAAKPKIASYPFTTLTPNLGFVQYRDNRSFVIADIPGIIEDAHLGKGLGHRFLRHIERNAVLLFMVPCDTDDIQKDFNILMRELEMYNEELLDKPRLLAITKCDLIDEEMQKLLRPTLPEDIDVVFISAVSGYGLDKLKDKLWNLLADQVIG
jgi:GTP-binding protein